MERKNMPGPPVGTLGTHPTPRRPWSFGNSADQNYEKRAAIALEYIAMYLDRIETHLERIADDSEKNRASLSAIAEVMPRLVSGVNR
jgi:hypothetical protein